MSWNCTAYFSGDRALLLTERTIVLCLYAAHTCLFNYKSDYSKFAQLTMTWPWRELLVFSWQPSFSLSPSNFSSFWFYLPFKSFFVCVWQLFLLISNNSNLSENCDTVCNFWIMLHLLVNIWILYLTWLWCVNICKEASK